MADFPFGKLGSARSGYFMQRAQVYNDLCLLFAVSYFHLLSAGAMQREQIQECYFHQSGDLDMSHVAVAGRMRC
jgi:hypothetical protein